MPKKSLISWSGGKDAAYALHLIRQDAAWDVVGLITTVTEGSARVQIHGVRLDLLEKQARALGLPLETVPIPAHCPNAVYEERLLAALRKHKAAGVEGVVFGDLFLEDIRRYRDELMTKAGLAGIYPLWGRDTSALSFEMLDSGLKARICSVDTRRLDERFVGREFDGALLASLPVEIDPCGENGEFHTFVHDGPEFRPPVAISNGSRFRQGDFQFVEILAGEIPSFGRGNQI